MQIRSSIQILLRIKYIGVLLNQVGVTLADK